MKAAIIASKGKVEIGSVDDPTPERRQVVIEVGGCGICGTDLHILQGEFAPSLPVIPGHELAGEVVAVGADVSEVRTGDLVAVDPSLYCGECHYRIYNEEITITGSMAVLHSFERAGELFAGGILDPDIFISHRLPLAEYEDALGLLANGVGRKIQVVPGLEAAVTRLAVSPLPPAGPSRARSARTRSPCKAASDLNSVER